MITPLFAVHPSDAPLIKRHIAAYLPEAVITPREESLEGIWNRLPESAIVEFGLTDEFMVPLAVGKMDLFIGLSSALAELQPDEVALFQVLFQPVRNPWAENILRAVTDGEGKPFFVNRPELLAAARQKLSSPLYAAVVRLAAKSEDQIRAWEIVRNMSDALLGLTTSNGNELIPLHNDEYPISRHEEDVYLRQSRRSGMLLNSNELLAFVHPPSPSVQTPKLVREKGNSKAAPSVVRNTGILLGQNVHAGNKTEVRLSQEQRTRHIHIIGISGSGKSTLLFNLIQQDIVNGEGLAVLDPHGDLIDQILGAIPSHRIDDVVLLDLSDEEYSIAFNILSAHSELEKTLLASDLTSVFKRLSSSWGDQMHSVLHNAILAFLESSQGGTLSDMRRFLLETAFRERFLQTVSDSEVVYYWQKAFPQLGGNKSIGPIMTRLEMFLGKKPIRYMVCQQANRLDFADIMDSGKIFLAKLPQGQIGKENAYLLGSLLMSRFQQQAMSRQSLAKAARRPFWLYADEADQFITPSMAEILTGARKYNLGLILAHHELRELLKDPDVAGAVLSNAGTRIVFRVGDADAKVLAEGFADFDANSLRKLGTGEAICRVERSDFDFNLTVPLPDSEVVGLVTQSEIIAASRTRYSKPRTEIEVELREAWQPEVPKIEKKPEEQEIPNVSEVEQVQEEPKVIPKAPESESLPRELAPALKVEESESHVENLPPKALGKGGQKHKYLQQFIKQWAQGMGYMAVIEQPIEGGQVDVALHKNERKIACEISVTTTAEHEVGNIKKCLASGYDFVVLIAPDEKRLSSLQKAVSPSLTEEDNRKVRFLVPEALFEFIESLDAQDATKSETIRGYKVKVKHQVVDKASKADRMKMLAKVMADSLKRKKD